MYNLHTPFLQASLSLKHEIFYIYWYEVFISIVAYGKEKLRIFSHVTLTIITLSVFWHPRAHGLCVWTPNFNNIKVCNWFEHSTWWMSNLLIGSLLTRLLSVNMVLELDNSNSTCTYAQMGLMLDHARLFSRINNNHKDSFQHCKVVCYIRMSLHFENN